jgi:HK97 gp10 family phage protein
MGVQLDVELKFDAEVLDALLRSSPQRQSAFLRGLAQSIVDDIKQSFGTSSGYRTYKRGNVTHTSSRPGEPPNVDTGALRNSIRWEEEAPGTVYVMDGVEYGAYLELGTENMAARPFMGPAIERAMQNLADFARDEGLLEP